MTLVVKWHGEKTDIFLVLSAKDKEKSKKLADYSDFLKTGEILIAILEIFLSFSRTAHLTSSPRHVSSPGRRRGQQLSRSSASQIKMRGGRMRTARTRPGRAALGANAGLGLTSPFISFVNKSLEISRQHLGKTLEISSTFPQWHLATHCTVQCSSSYLLTLSGQAFTFKCILLCKHRTQTTSWMVWVQSSVELTPSTTNMALLSVPTAFSALTVATADSCKAINWRLVTTAEMQLQCEKAAKQVICHRRQKRRQTGGIFSC